MSRRGQNVDTPTTRKRHRGEAMLEQHSARNIREGTTAQHDGKTASVRSGSYRTDRGKEILIPHVYDGRVVGRQEALQRAEGKPYPEYDTPEQATAVSKRISSQAGNRLGGPQRRGKQRK